MKKVKVAVAMSGGVDSGVAAALLVKEGYRCEGFHLKLFKDSSKESEKFARATAKKLKIPFHLVDLSLLFQKEVIGNFLQAYADGLTPNPCVVCNKFVKFGELLNYVRKLGFDYLATGHYARLARRETKYVRRETKYVRRKTQDKNFSSVSHITSHLLRARDEQKDQSYFLYNLAQSQLSHILFPVGNYQKKEVVAMAKRWNLPVAQRPESQEICFLKGKDYRNFLKENDASLQPGEVVDIKGRVIGFHQGLPLYTIGQRHGFKLISNFPASPAGGPASPAGGQFPISNLIPPFYVVGKDVKKNRLIVGFGKETERGEFWVKDVNWIDPNYPLTISHYPLLVRIRHQGDLLRCTARRETKDVIRKKQDASRIPYHVSLSEPERGIAPGQSAVFYQKLETGNSKLETSDDEVLGGGIIGLDNPQEKCLNSF